MRLNMTLMTATVLAASAMLGSQAMAANARIDEALKNRKDISQFYEAAQKMGVLAELKEGTTYTVFAPTNEAFAKLPEQQYPCFYSGQCRTEISDILRNHFIPEQVTFAGPVKGTVFSIDGMNVNLGIANGEVKSVAGHKIVNRGQVIGGTICQISGVIATPQELALVKQLKFVPVQVENKVIEKTVTDQVYYAPDGTPDGVSRTTSFSTVPAASVEPTVQ